MTELEQHHQVLRPQLAQAFEAALGQLFALGQAGGGGQLVGGIKQFGIVRAAAGQGFERFESSFEIARPLLDFSANRQDFGLPGREAQGLVQGGLGVSVFLLTQEGDRQVGVAEGILRHQGDQLAVMGLGAFGAFVFEFGKTQVAQLEDPRRRPGRERGRGEAEQ